MDSNEEDCEMEAMRRKHVKGRHLQDNHHEEKRRVMKHRHGRENDDIKSNHQMREKELGESLEQNKWNLQQKHWRETRAFVP